ncbi:unnamed protein product [marine sediment metagenome]|uniref:Uncharacterized protein n=1 Tax=marine sediment metagenome TaxID=412755 RepID=X1MW33_9ZZZZ
MKVYQRISLIIAYKSLLGLVERIIHRLFLNRHIHAVSAEIHKKKYAQLKEDFDQKALFCLTNSLDFDIIFQIFILSQFAYRRDE